MQYYLLGQQVIYSSFYPFHILSHNVTFIFSIDIGNSGAVMWRDSTHRHFHRPESADHRVQMHRTSGAM
jgi:hypothetical protein